MSRAEGVAAANVVARRQTPHVIIRSDRTSGAYVDGIYLEEKEERETVLVYTQPVSKKLEQYEIGERSMEDRNAWSTSDQKIRNKDKIEIGEGVFTIDSIRAFPFHIEYNLKRTGERQNISEGEE